MYVSVSCYNDGALLDGCLASVRDVLPDAEIVVVDGRYETWPDGPDNSTDDTPAVCQRHDAAYVPAGPFERERQKHRYRVGHAPEGEWMLLLDADERLVDVDLDALEDGTAYRPRIYNALVYGPATVYWPRVFQPQDVAAIARWDAYQFDVGVERTDAVTIAHRHDLRPESYREAKYERFANEDREGRYTGRFETYLHDEWDIPEAQTDSCPDCGATRTWSLATNHGSQPLSRVGVCLNGDCWTGTEAITVDEYRYLPDPDRVREGFAEDPLRVRVEAIDAGCPHQRGDLDWWLRLEDIIADWAAREFEADARRPA